MDEILCSWTPVSLFKKKTRSLQYSLHLMMHRALMRLQEKKDGGSNNS